MKVPCETTIPEDWTPPPWLTKPKYTVLELQWLCDQLQKRNEVLQLENAELRVKVGKHPRVKSKIQLWRKPHKGA